MRTTKKHLLAILLVLVAVLALSFTLAACNSDEQPEQPKDPAKTTYIVTIAPYEATQGTVTLAPASADGKYEEGTIVTVTVSAKAGFEVQSFAVSTDQNAALDNDGKYKLTVSANTTITATFKSSNVAVTSVTVSPAQSSLEVGRDDDQNKTVQLTAEVLPANATNKAVTWTSEDPTIATVSETGIVTAIAEGSATIKATAGGIEGTATITVTTHAHAAAQEAQWKFDSENEQHYHECEACGAHIDVAACAQDEGGYSFDSENQKHYKVCDVCNNHFDEAVCVPYDDWTEDEENGNHYQECKTCGSHINAENHVWGDEYISSSSYSYHWHVCEKCNAKSEGEAHTIDDSTVFTFYMNEQHQYLCKTCGYTITESCADYYVEWHNEKYHSYQCSRCKKARTLGDSYLQSQPEYKHKIVYTTENGKHVGKCTETYYKTYRASTGSGQQFTCTYTTEEEACTPGGALVQKDGDNDNHYQGCSVCGVPVESTKTAHTQHTWTYDDDIDPNNHHAVCECGVKLATSEAHQAGDNGVCKCGKHMSHEHALIMDVNGFTDGSCSCGENFIFEIDDSGSISIRKDSKIDEIKKLIIPAKVGGTDITAYYMLDLMSADITDLIIAEDVDEPSINDSFSDLSFVVMANPTIERILVKGKLTEPLNVQDCTSLQTVIYTQDVYVWSKNMVTGGAKASWFATGNTAKFYLHTDCATFDAAFQQVSAANQAYLLEDKSRIYFYYDEAPSASTLSGYGGAWHLDESGDISIADVKVKEYTAEEMGAAAASLIRLDTFLPIAEDKKRYAA